MLINKSWVPVPYHRIQVTLSEWIKCYSKPSPSFFMVNLLTVAFVSLTTGFCVSQDEVFELGLNLYDRIS